MPPHDLQRYRQKRRAGQTPEPYGSAQLGGSGARRFVVQKHAARRLHYDVRLEMHGVLKSWAVPRGPSLDPQVKRLAVYVEDHPLEYTYFEGTIPPDNYGAGNVIVWDMGSWVPLEDPDSGMERGKLLFELHGYKLHGVWTLVRTHKSDKEWLLIKKPDSAARPDHVFIETSVLSGLDVQPGQPPPPWPPRLRQAGAKERAFATPDPMLASVADAPFSRPDWLFELKYDGYRLLARRDGGSVQLIYRRGSDATALYPEIARALALWAPQRFLLDGELVAHDAAGLPSFQQLQQRALLNSPQDIARASVASPACLFAFDLLMLDGYDLRPLPLAQRKAWLHELVPQLGPVRYVDHIEARGEDFFAQVKKMGLEGIMAKQADSPYASVRSQAWLKMPVRLRDAFTIVGFSAPKGSRSGFGALIVASGDRAALRIAGSVGSGFDAATLEQLHGLLEPLARKTPPCDLGNNAAMFKRVTWVKPQLRCRVVYKQITRDGLLRMGVFDGLEASAAPPELVGQPPPPAPVLAAPRQVSFTNVKKIFWPEDELTKGDLIDYYRAIAPQILPYLRDRPVTLTRYPDGIHGKSFFQKDAPQWTPDWVQRVRLPSEAGKRDIDYFVCNDVESLLYIANLGTIPLHIGAARLGSLGQPDWCVLDLDPKAAPFADVVRVARAVKKLCDQLELTSFVKTSGSTGLHVILPLQGQLTFDQTRSLAEVLARVLVQQQPGIATVERVIEARDGKVYIDTGQNGHGKLLAAPFCVRPVPGALVSMPLAWREVNARLDIRRWNISSALGRVASWEDPWENLFRAAVDIRGALGRLESLA